MKPSINLVSSRGVVELEISHPAKEWEFTKEELQKDTSGNYIHFMYFKHNTKTEELDEDERRPTYKLNSQKKYFRHGEDVTVVFTSIYIKNNAVEFTPPTEPVNTQRPGGGG